MENYLPASSRFQVRKCTGASCGLRFSILSGDRRGERCPLCRAETMVLDAGYERSLVLQKPDTPYGPPTGPELEVLLDNIRSAWNVGSMLRSSDGAGVRRVHLCGVSSSPENPKVWKTSLGAERALPWNFAPDGVELVRALKSQGLRIWALEGGSRAESLFDMEPGSLDKPILLVVGNELTGVDPGIMDLCERVVCLPMHGMKSSLNVAVAFGVAAYYIRYGLRLAQGGQARMGLP